RLHVRRRRLRLGAAVPRRKRGLVGAPLADEDLRSFTIVGLVLPARRFQERIDGAVVVLVDDVRPDAVDALVLRVLEADGRDDLQLRIARLDGVGELREALIVRARSIEEVLVAHLDVGQREWRWVAGR